MKINCSLRNMGCHIKLSALLWLAFLLNTTAADRPVPPLTCTPARAALTFSQPGTSTSLSYDGKIIFTDDERDIKSITPGGFFRLSKTTFGHKREIFIQSGSDGTLYRRYYVGRSEVAYEPEGRQWLQEVLPEIIASTSLGAEDRIRRIYAKAGLQGLLAAIDEMENAYAQATYYRCLLTQLNLKDHELKGVLTHLNRNLDSDYEKSKLLRQIGPRYLRNSKNAQHYLNTVSALSSDYEKARVLTYVLQTPHVSPSSCELVIPAVAHIHSDYEQAKVLKAALAKPGLSLKAYKEVIELSRIISSDYEKNRVLLRLLDNEKYATTHFAELIKAISSMDSDYEKSRALSTLIAKQKLNAQHYLQLLPLVSTLGSSYEKSRSLQKIRASMPADNAEVRAAYIRAAKTIGSEYEYRKVIAGLD